MIKTKKLLILAITILTIACNSSENYNLPEDLLYKGKPVHPTCITRFYGNSAEADLKICSQKHYIDESNMKIINNEMYYDPTIPLVSSSLEYKYTYRDDDRTDVISDEYMYIGSHKNKHVVAYEFYDTSGTGRFNMLSVIKRENNKIIDAGIITGGDRGYGTFEVIGIKNNILTFSTPTHYTDIIESLTGKSFYATNDELINSSPAAFYSSDIDLIYEVDLNSKPAEYNTYPRACPISPCFC